MPSTTRFSLACALIAAASLAAATPVFAARDWAPPADLGAATSPWPDTEAATTPSGETMVVTNDDFGAGKAGFRVALRAPGGSFSEQILPAGGSAKVVDGDEAAVDLAADGSAIVAWVQSDGVFFAQRPAGGAFGAPQPVTGTTTTGADYVAVSLDGAGNATFIIARRTGAYPNFSASIVSIQRRADGVFDSLQTLGTAPNTPAGFVDPMIDTNAAGSAVAAWKESFGMGAGDSHYTFRITPVGKWGGILDAAGARSAAAAIDEAGNAAVVIDDANGVSGRYRAAGGGLTAPKVLGISNSPSKIAIAADGKATALWFNAQGGTDRLLSCSFTSAGCLAPPAVVADLPSINGADLAQAPSGAAVVTWTADLFGTPTVGATTRPAGGVWVAPKTIGTAGSKYPSAAIDAAGDGVAAWIFTDAAGARTRVADFAEPAPAPTPAPPATPAPVDTPRAAPTPPTPAPPTGPAADTRAPRFTSAPRIRGKRFTYALDEAATVTIAITRTTPGKAKQRKALTFTRASAAGASRVTFKGRVGKTVLKPGVYRVTFTPRDAAGNRGTTRTATLRIAKR